MLKQNIDYSNTVTHKIVCKNLNINDLYYGSTTHFTKRKGHHKTLSQTSSNLPKYITIRDNGGVMCTNYSYSYS